MSKVNNKVGYAEMVADNVLKLQAKLEAEAKCSKELDNAAFARAVRSERSKLRAKALLRAEIDAEVAHRAQHRATIQESIRAATAQAEASAQPTETVKVS